MFNDTINFTVRDYASLAEARTQISASKFRVGKHLIFIHQGGTLSVGVWTGGYTKIYVWGAGTGDNDLIPYFDFLAAGGLTVDADSIVHFPKGIEGSDLAFDNGWFPYSLRAKTWTGPMGDSLAVVNQAMLQRRLNSLSLNPPGSDQQVIFNDAGAFGASNLMYFNKSTGRFTVTNTAYIGALLTAPPTGSTQATVKIGSVSNNIWTVDINGVNVPIPTTGYTGFGSGQTITNQTHTTGSTVTITSSIAPTIRLTVNPSSVLANLTVTMPSTPVDGQVIKIFFGPTITSGNTVVTNLTVVGNSGATVQGGAVGEVTNGDDLQWTYNSSLNTWQ